LTLFISTNQKEDKHITIGAPLSLTGMASVDGQNIKDGIEFAKKELAKDGIILEVVYEDDATEPAKTVSAIKKLKDFDKVDAIIGPTWSFLASASADTIQQNKIVSYNPANTSEHVEGQSEYFLFGAPKNSLKEKPTEEWLKTIGAKKVAIVLEQGSWGDSHIKPFENAIKSSGAELVLTERIAFGATGVDIQTIISKVVNSGADTVLFTGFDESTALMINKREEMKATYSMLVASGMARKQNEEGKINVDTEDNIYIIDPVASKEFQQAFEKEYGRLPGAYSDSAYDGTMMLAKAILEKPEGADLNQYIRQMNYKGYMGTYTFDSNNDLSGGEWVVEQIK
jgi:branched-chain amino acid transport system substrate-binding protein